MAAAGAESGGAAPLTAGASAAGRAAGGAAGIHAAQGAGAAAPVAGGAAAHAAGGEVGAVVGATAPQAAAGAAGHAAWGEADPLATAGGANDAAMPHLMRNCKPQPLRCSSQSSHASQDSSFKAHQCKPLCTACLPRHFPLPVPLSSHPQLRVCSCIGIIHQQQK